MARPERHPDHENHGHPSASTVCFHPEDDALRRHGYTIHARPKSGPVVWRRKDGTLAPHAEALAAIEEAFAGKARRG